MVTRVFCVPGAGGTAAAFRAWQRRPSSSVAVVPLELPGRGTRSGQRPLDDLPGLAADLASQVRAVADSQFALLGHSMGALIGYEMAQLLLSAGLTVRHLFVLASPAPQSASRSADSAGDPHPESLSALDDDDFLRALRSHQSIPENVRNNIELLALAVPWIRADFRACENYRPQNGKEALDCSITALIGRYDRTVAIPDVQLWKACTAKEFRLLTVPSGHDVMAEAETFVARCVENTLSSGIGIDSG